MKVSLYFHIFSFAVVIPGLNAISGSSLKPQHLGGTNYFFSDFWRWEALQEKKKKSKYSALFPADFNSNQRACTKKPIKISNTNPPLSAAPLLKTNVQEQTMTTSRKAPPTANPLQTATVLVHLKVSADDIKKNLSWKTLWWLSRQWPSAQDPEPTSSPSLMKLMVFLCFLFSRHQEGFMKLSK